MATGVHRLTFADLTNLAVERPDTPMHQGALGVLDGEGILDQQGRLLIARIRAAMLLKIDRVPELRRVLFQTGPFQGRPLWVDDSDFRIEKHVLAASLPGPGGEAEAIRFAEQEMAILMDRSRPLWQLWFLEGYGEGTVGLFLKVHHAFADGPAILNLLAQLFDLAPEAVEGTPGAWVPARVPAARALAFDSLASKFRSARAAVRSCAHPGALLRSIARTARGVQEALTEGRGAPRLFFNRPVGAGRRVGVVRLRLDEVKAIAHEKGVKINDVFLDLVAGGVREVLATRGALVDEIHASMAVSLHGVSDSAMAGNHAGTVIVPLPVGGDDPVARLRMISSATRKAKARQRAAVPQALMVVLAITGLTRFFIRRQHLVNVLATDLQGPQFPLYVAGACLLDAFAIPPIAGNVTVSFAALSYDGGFDVSVHADRGAWPDLAALTQGMLRSWSRLKEGSAGVSTLEGSGSSRPGAVAAPEPIVP